MKHHDRNVHVVVYTHLNVHTAVDLAAVGQATSSKRKKRRGGDDDDEG